MRRIVLALAVVFAAQAAVGMGLNTDQADIQNLIAINHPELPDDHPCKKVNLTEEQRASLKELAYETKQKMIQASADLKKAMLTLHHTFLDQNSLKAEGAVAQEAAALAMSAGMKIIGDAVLNVNYDILQPGQREDAFKCMMHMRRRKPPGNDDPSHGHPGHPPGGDHPGHPGHPPGASPTPQP